MFIVPQRIYTPIAKGYPQKMYSIKKIRAQQFPTRKSLCAVVGVVDNVMVFVAGILSRFQVERFSFKLMMMMMVD